MQPRVAHNQILSSSTELSNWAGHHGVPKGLSKVPMSPYNWGLMSVFWCLKPQIAICSPSAVGYEVLKLLHVIKYIWLPFSVWSPPSPFHLIWEVQKLFIRHTEVCRHLQLTPYDPFVCHLVIILDPQDCLTPIITLIALNCPWVHCLIIKFLLELTILPLLSVCRHAVSLQSKYL